MTEQSTPSGTVILDQITKRFGDVCAVQNLSLSVQSGSIFGLVGSNGAGKSTTLKILCGLEKPTSGTAEIDGLDCWKQRARVKMKLGYVPQSFDLYLDLTVEEHLHFFATAFRLRKEERERQISGLLKRTDLAAKKNGLRGQPFRRAKTAAVASLRAGAQSKNPFPG